jgi:CxC1 like cysteine cluster associated with KDZ transposases
VSGIIFFSWLTTRPKDLIVLGFTYTYMIYLGLQLIEMRTCQCSPAAIQLLSLGLFPCTPIAPTLAVDFKMLDFVRELFVRMPPNTTSWCETIEAVLGKRGYKLTTRVCVSVGNLEIK